MQERLHRLQVGAAGDLAQIVHEHMGNIVIAGGQAAQEPAQDATTGVYENLPKKKESNYTPIFM